MDDRNARPSFKALLRDPNCLTFDFMAVDVDKHSRSVTLRLSETWRGVVRRRLPCEGDHQAGHWFATRVPS
jgi:hypothetical protein